MNTELLGMSNEELIQWACKYGCVGERKLRKAFPSIELFCAQHAVGIGEFLENVIARVNGGCSLQNAISLTKDVAL